MVEKRRFPKSFEAFGTKCGGNTSEVSFGPRRDVGWVILILIPVLEAGACASFLAELVQTPFDLFPSFSPSVVPSVYTIYMGKDKYESKYINIMMPDGLDVICGDLWSF